MNRPSVLVQVAALAMSLGLVAMTSHAAAGAPSVWEKPQGCVPLDIEPIPACVPARTEPERVHLWLETIENWADQGRLAEVLSETSAHRSAIENSTDAGAKVRLYVLQGRALYHKGERKEAEAQYGQAIALWEEPSAALWVKALEASDYLGSKRVEAAIDAAGRAAFALGDMLADDVEKIACPEYKGTAYQPNQIPLDKMTTDQFEKEMVKRKRLSEFLHEFVEKQVTPWRKATKEGILKAALAYERIARLPPRPSARWLIASNARLAALWERFGSDERRFPSYSSMLNESEVKGVFIDVLGPPPPSPFDWERRALEACVDISDTRRTITADTLYCEERLRRFSAFNPPLLELGPGLIYPVGPSPVKLGQR